MATVIWIGRSKFEALGRNIENRRLFLSEFVVQNVSDGVTVHAGHCFIAGKLRQIREAVFDGSFGVMGAKHDGDDEQEPHLWVFPVNAAIDLTAYKPVAVPQFANVRLNVVDPVFSHGELDQNVSDFGYFTLHHRNVGLQHGNAAIHLD